MLSPRKAADVRNSVILSNDQDWNNLLAGMPARVFVLIGFYFDLLLA
jgi:hypothetical protein